MTTIAVVLILITAQEVSGAKLRLRVNGTRNPRRDHNFISSYIVELWRGALASLTSSGWLGHWLLFFALMYTSDRSRFPTVITITETFP